jgi:DNA-binding NtrC family response regulator
MDDRLSVLRSTRSEAMKRVLDQVRALREAPHLSVLIRGETGTGKELIAKFLHSQENNPQRPFIVVNMPAVPATLLEAELFGTEKGAYTDGRWARAGKFEMASGGDIFLDEIGDLSPEAQAKILRVLQEREVQRLGSNEAKRVNFRVICATHRPLEQMVKDGIFRLDLFYRISDIAIDVPPLRLRREDIESLAYFFLETYDRYPRRRAFSPAAMELMYNHDWPGNVRELESAIKRAVIYNTGEGIHHIEFYANTALHSPKVVTRFYERVACFERSVFLAALNKNEGDRAKTMLELGLCAPTFYRKLRKLRITDGAAS